MNRRDLLFKFIPGSVAALWLTKLPKPDEAITESVSPPAPLSDDECQRKGIYYLGLGQEKSVIPRLFEKDSLSEKQEVTVKIGEDDRFWLYPDKDGEDKT